jgi:hypothetical protein
MSFCTPELSAPLCDDFSQLTGTNYGIWISSMLFSLSVRLAFPCVVEAIYEWGGSLPLSIIIPKFLVLSDKMSS